MKKYGKTLITFAAIILVIAGFYIKDALAASSYPAFTFVHQSGDESEIENVAVEGVYSQGMMNPINESFVLTAEGTQYDSESPYADQLNGEQGSGFINRMLKEHRRFMRGKSLDPAAFYEDEAVIAYGNADFHLGSFGTGSVKHIFQVAVLDKEKEKITSFEADIPDGNDMESIYLNEVQMLDGVLKLITVNEYAGKGTTEVHVYNFDIVKKKLISDETAVTFKQPGEESQYIDVGLVERTAHHLDENHMIISKQIWQDEQREDGDFEMKQVGREGLIMYNLKTEKAEEITVPKSLPEDAYAAYYDESFIYFTAQDGEEFSVIPYSISKGKVTRETVLADAGDNTSVIKDGKLYLVAGREMPAVYVIDLKTGNTLYEGEITLEKQTADKKSDELYINGIDVQ
jgi:hypothetical protein